MKIIYGDNVDQLNPDQLRMLTELDTYDSGEDTYIVNGPDGKRHDGILDSAHEEIDLKSMDKLLSILNGGSIVANTPSKKEIPATVNTTPNGKTYRDGIVDIPGGQFDMGSTAGMPDEQTASGRTVRVTMSPFSLSKSEVTVGQYKAYLVEMGDPQYSRLPNILENKKGDQFPVVGLTYAEKMAFCRHYGGTLPTAAQIEYASKGPSHTDDYGSPQNKAATLYNGFKESTEVCGINNERANGYGVCDLAGNVWETTLDQYDGNFYNRMAAKDPSNPLQYSTQLVELRGGSWRSQNHRSADRHFINANSRSIDVGFRCAWPSS